jgi:hypothetical protein
MIEMTMQLRQGIIDLLEEVQKSQTARGEEPWTDSRASKECFGHGEFMLAMRKWEGGRGGPTMEKTLAFERFLAEQIGEKKYHRFLKRRGRSAPQQGEENLSLDEF